MLYRSSILLTPYLSGTTIDVDKLTEFFHQAYHDANFRPEHIDTGAVVSTDTGDLAGAAVGLDLQARDALIVRNGAALQTLALGAGDASGISIVAGSLTVSDGGFIESSSPFASGRSGGIDIRVVVTVRGRAIAARRQRLANSLRLHPYRSTWSPRGTLFPGSLGAWRRSVPPVYPPMY